MTTYLPYHYGAVLENLSQAEKNLAVAWSEDMLKGGDDSTKGKLGKLDQLIESMPPLGTEISVYRGINVGDWTEIVLDINHFVATATNAAATRHFGTSTCCFMEIIVPPEAKVLPLSYEHGLTRYPKDLEVLIPRHGVFKVVGSRRIDLELHNNSMYSEEIQRAIAEAMARSAFRQRVDDRLFVTLEYLPNGRMTRSLAKHNTESLARIYGVA